MKKDFVFTPTRDAVPCLVPPSFHSRGKFATIQFVNDTDCTVFMEAGTVVGTVIAGDEMPIPEKKGERKVRKVRRKEASSQVLPEHLVDLYKRSSEGLTEAEKEELKALLIEYADVFSAHDLDLGCFSATPHRINFEKEETSPIRQRMRRVPKGFEEEEEKHLKQMLEAGVIQLSVSPWASPPVLGKKPGWGLGGWGGGGCLDFRKLNAVTKKDAFPLPLISDCIDSLAGNKYMSTLDMASGYWQIERHPDDREKTAFITRFGLFEHRRMSFGLCNAPSTFQRAMNLERANVENGFGIPG